MSTWRGSLYNNLLENDDIHLPLLSVDVVPQLDYTHNVGGLHGLERDTLGLPVIHLLPWICIVKWSRNQNIVHKIPDESSELVGTAPGGAEHCGMLQLLRDTFGHGITNPSELKIYELQRIKII